jgi:hypothetical protein
MCLTSGSSAQVHRVAAGVDLLHELNDLEPDFLRLGLGVAVAVGIVSFSQPCGMPAYRDWLSHKVNRYDMNTKYGDVIFVDEAVGYLPDHALSSSRPLLKWTTSAHIPAPTCRVQIYR